MPRRNAPAGAEVSPVPPKAGPTVPSEMTGSCALPPTEIGWPGVAEMFSNPVLTKVFPFTKSTPVPANSRAGPARWPLASITVTPSIERLAASMVPPPATLRAVSAMNA